MNARLVALRRQMEAAAAALDFEEAQRLRDLIGVLHGAEDPAPEVEIDTSRLHRQQPGRMGLGTSEATPARPKGWTPPPKPDLMTSGTRPAKHRR